MGKETSLILMFLHSNMDNKTPINAAHAKEGHVRSYTTLASNILYRLP